MKTIRDPFAVERLRAKLAEENNLRQLLKTYSADYPEIPDHNTVKLWDVLNRQPQETVENPMADDRLKIVIAKIKGEHIRVLDVGFGSASLEKAYFSSGRTNIDWHGIDISGESVKQAKQFVPEAQFTKGTITSIHHKDNSFDYVIALEVLEHIPPRKTFTALRELKRVLRRKGILIISVPLHEGLEAMVRSGYNPNAHVRVYTPALIQAELEQCGFTIQNEQFIYAFSKLYTVKKLLAKISPRPIWLPNNIIIQSQKL